MNLCVLLVLTFNQTDISRFYETRTLLGILLLNREIRSRRLSLPFENRLFSVGVRFPVVSGIMLKNIFPMEKALRKSDAGDGIAAHDDLVSIICMENERCIDTFNIASFEPKLFIFTSIERSVLFQSLVTTNREGCCVVYVTKEPFGALPEPVEDMPSADPLYMDAVTFM